VPSRRGEPPAYGSLRRRYSPLRRRGVEDPAASLAAEAAVAVFKIAFDKWVNERDPQDLPLRIRESLQDLKAVAVGA
jgi:hypothetical protein